MVDPTCSVIPECCRALLEANRYFYMLGRDSRTEGEMRALHATIYTIVGGC